MSNQFKTKQFKTLKDKWYQKLEKEGFNDIEYDENSLIVWESTSFQNRYDPAQAEFNTEYYRAAGHFLHDYQFENNRQRIIWEQHANGITIADTSKVLKRKRIQGYSGSSVHKTLKTLQKEMLLLYGRKNTRQKRPDNN